MSLEESAHEKALTRDTGKHVFKPKTRAPAKGRHSNGARKVNDLRLSLHSKDEVERAKRHKAAQKQYGRGRQIQLNAVQDKKLKRRLGIIETRVQKAADDAKDAEVLLEMTDGFLEAETDLERTYKVRQEEIVKSAPIAVAQKRFELKLDQLGPYFCEFSRTGRELLLAGRKGHLATMDWREGKMGCELQLGETIRDACWLHNNQYFAVAQKSYVYIYDRNGVELHNLRRHNEVSHMQFLPYHFLLATMSMSGQLKYQDVSIGKPISEINTKTGGPCSLTQNPHNAILHAGHQNGTVTLWSPNSSNPLVKILAHKGPVRSLAVDREGRYMVSAGQDHRMAVWDIRMFKGEVRNFRTNQPGSSLSISDKGVVAVGHGTHTTLWKDILSKPAEDEHERVAPYMRWGGDGKTVERVRFCPFEDVLGVGHNAGFSSFIVPGAGEANYDTLEINPYETTKQRQDTEVNALLNKLQPEMIALDPNFVGKLGLLPKEEQQTDKKNAGKASVTEIRNRVRERNSTHKEKDKVTVEAIREDLGPALGRFARREVR